MKTILAPFRQLRIITGKLEILLDRLRVRIPGLPANRVVFSAAALVLVAAVLFVAFQKLLAPKDSFTSYTLPYEQNFDDVNLRRWFVGDGVWTIRNAALAQTVGGDKPAQVHIPLKMVADTPYHASVYITLKKDSKAAGLSFNAQYPELAAQQHRVYLSRPVEDKLELVSGFMDETGSFVPQAQVALNINTTDFRLDLYVYSNTYLVQVNGQRLIDERPLFYKNGLLGFYALGPAVFDTFKLTVADNPSPGDMVYSSDFDRDPGGAGWVPFGGTWKIAEKQMAQSDPAAINAGISYEASTFQNFTLRATFSHLAGQGAGILFDMPSPYQINGAHIVRFSDETDALIWGYFDAVGMFNRQGFANLPPPGDQVHTLQIFSGDNSYDVFLDDQVLARGVALQNTQGHIGLVTSAASAKFSQVEVFPLFGENGETTLQLTPVLQTGTPLPAATLTQPLLAATHTVPPLSATPKVVRVVPTGAAVSAVTNGALAPYHGAFSGQLADQGWIALSGDWLFQDGNFVQFSSEGFDFSAIYTKTIFRNFSMQVGLAHQQGSGGGLLFNMPFTDRLNGAYLVRYSDRRDNAIIWGYFDENGVYKNQGYADVPSASTSPHTLRIVSVDASYSIYLDDRLIVQAVPFVDERNYGYIGLLTSRSSVIYNEVTVDGAEAAFKSIYSTLDGFTDQRTVSGEWQIEADRILQTVSAPADYVWNTGVQAVQYTISAKITLPDQGDAGGGFMLRMAERGSKNNAYLLRLIKGGAGIWWGATDSSGKFKGQGSASLKRDPAMSTSPAFTVKATVKDNKMTLWVDDQQIATGVLLPGDGGWIGLVAYGGPVIFQDVRLEVEN